MTQTTLRDKLNQLKDDAEYQTELEKLKPEFEVLKILKQVREDTGMTQRELAVLLNKPQSTISRIESGSNLPSLQTLFDLARVTGKELQIKLV